MTTNTSPTVQRALIPQPAHIIYGTTEPQFELTTQTDILTDSQTYTIGALLASTLAPVLGFTLPVLPTTHAQNSRPKIALLIDPSLQHLTNEGYQLTVTEQEVVIRGSHPAGVFYGTQTLRQLLPVDIFSPIPIEQHWHIPAVTIEDKPEFAWRGCMLDSARFFIPKAQVLKFIDQLALHKMNVLHLHLTDDQGWRIEIKKYPKLTDIGSRRKETIVGHQRAPQGFDGTPHEGYYSQQDLKEIVAYAAERFITVVPEIDMPGHAQAALAAYPEYGVTGQPIEVGTQWGVYPHLYSPTEETLQFLRDILTEVMDIFPSPYIHIGGDEAEKEQWIASPAVQALIKKLDLADEEALQGWFLTQIGNFLTEHDRRLVGWDEIIDGGLPAEATVMSWRGIEGGIRAARLHHDVVMTPQTHVYLDHYQSNDPTEQLAIGGYTPLHKIYGFHPIPDELTAEQARHIIGVQANIWREYIPTVEHLEYMSFPRLFALAEIAWTPVQQRDFDDFKTRLTHHEARLTHMQLTFWPVARLAQEHTHPARKDWLSSSI